MLKRRTFLAASVLASVAATLPAPAFALTPLYAAPKPRRIFAKPEDGGSWLLYSDGPDEPRQIIRHAALDRAFGPGASGNLSLRDHWEMIDAGWFSGADLHQPVPLADPAYDLWQACYHPVTEAHDLLTDLFATKYFRNVPMGGWTLPNGLALAEHPSTPRYATARVPYDEALLRCVFDAENTNDLIRIVLPQVLEPLRQRYADPDDYEYLMGQTRSPTYQWQENGYERAARKAHAKSSAPLHQAPYD